MISHRIILIAAIALSITLGATAIAAAAPPEGVTAAAFHGRVEIAWQPAPGATGYRVFRGLSESGVTQQVSGDLPPSATSYTDSAGLVGGTEYFYAVRAIGEGVDSRVVAATPSVASCDSANPVAAENCLDGLAQWRVQNPSGIEGFSAKQSVNRGDSVDLKVSSNAAYDLQIVRTGYYGGLGAREVGRVFNIPARSQSCPAPDSHGMVDCNWIADHRLTTTASWPSGVYMINLIPRGAPWNTNAILLVIRDDQRSSDLLYGVPDTTYQAYNDYGGKSLYGFNSPGGQATKVSFNRPYVQANPMVDQPNWYMRTDRATVYWLEQNGYDVTYTAVSDLDRDPGTLLDHRGFISGAHDEYYSDTMRLALEQARAARRHLFFSGANAVFQKVRFENGGRTLVDFKTPETTIIDPVSPTGPWRDPAGANRPENALLGAMYIGDRYPGGFHPLRVSAEEGRNRIWRHTGLDVQPPGASAQVGTGLVGWEWDARIANGLEPAGLEVAASSPVEGNLIQGAGPGYGYGNATAEMTRYVAASGAAVVNTATNAWFRGLVPGGVPASNPLFPDGQADVRIRQATMNILADMRAAPATPEPDLVYDPPPPDLEPPTGGTLGPVVPGATVSGAKRVSGTIKARWKRSGRITKLKRLWATGVAKGSTIEIRCPDKRCGKKRTAIRAGRDGTIQLRRYVKNRSLRPGSVLEARILAGGKIGKVTRYTTRRKQAPRRLVRCLAPGAVKLGAC